jgi:RNA polymerase-binding transcription factor DksA
MSAADPADDQRLRDAIESERVRIASQVANLEQSFAGIVDGTELTSTDDEHDPEGTTIAYERAQVSALLRQGRDDLESLEQALRRVDDGTALTCVSCGGPIALERVLALPMTRLCVTCAS